MEQSGNIIGIKEEDAFKLKLMELADGYRKENETMADLLKYCFDVYCLAVKQKEKQNAVSQ